MINEERKIKELYDCEYITSDEDLYPLQKWYNKLIDKSIDEINIADILRMLRQKVFTKLAMLKAIEFLRKNIFAGELYDGELLEKISELDATFLTSYADDLKSILKNSVEKCTLHTWSYDGEEEEFKEIIKSIQVKLT